ncbi:MAG TPA: aldo/keto reductase [Candidatus Latescibacteria bacterium]|jgi:aryl-alcohol dehydrogenase-like predicted oxidoreductase|nr:dTDP-4-keto-L-6-deoxy-hexose 2,3-reductase [Gemmatimonadaceae bacterium]MDP6018496.1 aldo/keto reductase [Candidatus Latescibacterota bacterium]HJP31913.1 aldo/keto reductase [Candidatus Latescibacterota bacterium]
MNMRTLGRTGLEVGELSLGAAFVTKGEDGFKGTLPVVRRALELGINLADTSADYGDSEEALGWALEEAAKPCIVSTKLGPPPGWTDFQPKDKDQLRRIVDLCLTNLRRDVIDIMMVHEPDRPGQFDWYQDDISFHGPVVDLLQELKDEGVIKHIGIGGTGVYELARLCDTGLYDVVLTAFNSSPLWRDALTHVIPVANRHDMGVFLASPTQQGWLVKKYDLDNGVRWLSPPRRAQLQAFYDFIDEIDMELPVFCLRWALGVQGVSTVLTGPRNVAQLEQNFQAVEQGPLPEDVCSRLDEIYNMLPHRPFEEPAICRLEDPKYWGPGRVS